MTQVATFNLPWRIAFLPDGRMLITEKSGALLTWSTRGDQGRSAMSRPSGGRGRAACSASMSRRPSASDQTADLFRAGAGRRRGRPGAGQGQACPGRDRRNGQARLDGLKVIWRDGSRGKGGQYSAAVAFAPDGKSLFLTSGDRQRFTPAQDPNTPVGKIT